MAAPKNGFQFRSKKISSRKPKQKKKGTLLLIASVRAVAVGEHTILSGDSNLGP